MRLRKSYRPFIKEELKTIIGRKIVLKTNKIEYLITEINVVSEIVLIDNMVWIPSSDLLYRYNFTNNKVCGKLLEDNYKEIFND